MSTNTKAAEMLEQVNSAISAVLEKYPEVCRVAVGFSFQILPEVPTEPTDIRPQVIVTEENIYRDTQ